MVRAFALLTVILISVSATLASTISGKLYWTSGTVVKAFYPSTGPENIEVKIGAKTETITAVVPGSTTSEITSGTILEFLESSSQPFAADYASTTCTVSDNDGTGILGRRSVAISTTGVLQDTIAYPVGMFTFTSLSFYLPACSIGTLEFKNGVTAGFSTLLPSYDLSIPVGSTATLGSIAIPSSADPIETFNFTAQGNGALTFQGSGSSDTLWITGLNTGAPSFFTSASLSITPSYTF